MISAGSWFHLAAPQKYERTRNEAKRMSCAELSPLAAGPSGFSTACRNKALEEHYHATSQTNLPRAKNYNTFP